MAGGPVVAVRTVGGLVVAGLLATGSASVVATFFQQRHAGTTTLNAAVTRLVVRNDVGDVRVRAAAEGTQTRVTRTRQWSFREPGGDATTTDGVLTVTGDCAGLLLFNGFCSVDLDVAVPAGVTVQVRNGIGDVRTTDVTGAIDVESGTGEIVVIAPGSPNVAARTGVGDVSVTGGAENGRVQTQTGTGDVTYRLTAAENDIVAETGTGDVTIQVPIGASYRVSTDTGAGDVRVGVPRDDASQHRITVTTGTGDITVQTS